MGRGVAQASGSRNAERGVCMGREASGYGGGVGDRGSDERSMKGEREGEGEKLGLGAMYMRAVVMMAYLA